MLLRWARALLRRGSSEAIANARLQALDEADCAIAAARVTDTIKEAEGDVVVATHDRSRLWAVQTPQAFRREALKGALSVDAAILARATDDAWLVERAGGTVRVVEPLGAHTLITSDVDGHLFRAVLDSTATVRTGDRLTLKPKPDRIRWFDPETTAAL